MSTSEETVFNEVKRILKEHHDVEATDFEFVLTEVKLECKTNRGKMSVITEPFTIVSFVSRMMKDYRDAKPWWRFW